MEGVDTRENQIEALRVLSAGNTLIIVLLGGVLALQVHETAFVLWRAERRSHTFYGAHRAQGAQEDIELARMAAEETKEREGVEKDAL